ncbi:MAG: M4 family metallopeptidase, partial [Ignavibacteria bacterium]
WGTEKTWDYYYNYFGRNSVDNLGKMLVSLVHYDVNYLNAYWDGTNVVYGDAYAPYTPLTSLEVVGHEISHGVTQFTSNLNYAKEPGALNESFSDCMGVSIRRYGKGTANVNWLQGDEFGLIVRDMANPKAHGQPDTYHGQYWVSSTFCTPSSANDYCGVHTNSGVMNKWYYLMTMGGSGTNDYGYNYSVSSLGIIKAAAITYRMQSVYNTPTSKYADARINSIQAATDLYGVGSPEANITSDAWCAVGVFGNSSICSILPTHQLPLKLGQSVVTLNEFEHLDNNVVRIIDTRNRPANIPGGHYWNTSQYSNPDWTYDKMGSIFGIALDNEPSPNIFVARTTIYSQDPQNLPGLIYRIDGTTEAVTDHIIRNNIAGPPSTAVGTNKLPNTGPGLGNLCYDKYRKQIFVTNFEDGVIYRIKNGSVLSYFDPFSPDNGQSGHAPKGERLWGIGMFGNRVYFSRYVSDESAQSNGPNEIWSVQLNNTGDFNPSTLRIEITLPLMPGKTYSNPVSDIEFSFAGTMLVGERTMYDNITSAHSSRMLEFSRVNGTYGSYIWHRVGSITNLNSCGGVDFAYGKYDSITNTNSHCDSVVISTGDFIFNTPLGMTYGMQITDRSSAGNLNVANYSQYIDINNDLSNYDKSMSGDVDVYRTDVCRCILCPAPFDATIGIAGISHPDTLTQVKDTVRIYLRSSIVPYPIIDSAKGVLDIYGSATFNFSNTPDGTYYVVVKHRNSIETWSANPVTINGESSHYDFTSASTQAYGENMMLVGKKWCIYSGDINHDGLIDLTDVIGIFNDASIFTTGYVVTDINGDNIVDLSDLTAVYNNSTSFVSSITPLNP